MKYTFTESNGMVLTFNSQGQLEKVTDPNGNTVTVTYTNGKLTKLADEFGNSLIITYNANGKIESVTDNLGNATTYTYDMSGKNLVKVTNVQYGLSVDYVYNDYKLSEINYADGNSQHFVYANGILVETYIDGMTLTKYVGGNTAKDLLKYEVYEGTTLVQTIWFKTRGQIAKGVDAQGRMVIYE
jgi:YD repeat-containing protein